MFLNNIKVILKKGNENLLRDEGLTLSNYQKNWHQTPLFNCYFTLLNRAWPWRLSDLVLNICHCNNLFLKEWSIYLSSCFDYSGNLRMFFFKIILLESTCYLWTSNVKYWVFMCMIYDYRDIFHCCRYHLQYWWKCRGLLNVLVLV